MLAALLRNSSVSTYQALVGALVECGAIVDERPVVIGCRLPLETDYRDFWEFPYSDGLKMGLMTALIQSRAVLAWLRNLAAAGVDPADVRIIPRPDAESFVNAIGGVEGAQVAARARSVEQALYQVMGALLAPAESDLPPEATGAYQPFDIIESFQITVGTEGQKQTHLLRPLAILDDAHVLHPSQFQGLQRWLARRELRIARWMIARFDVLLPQEALAALTEDRADAASYPGLSQDREIEVILLQKQRTTPGERTNFRRMAKDMAGRYLRRMPLLSTRNLVVLGDMLGDEEVSISTSERKRLADGPGHVAQRRLQIAGMSARQAWQRKQIAASCPRRREAGVGGRSPSDAVRHAAPLRQAARAAEYVWGRRRSRTIAAGNCELIGLRGGTTPPP